jgi:hypothetical protein
MEFTKDQLNTLRKAMIEYITNDDWQDDEHADLMEILNMIGEERCK